MRKKPGKAKNLADESLEGVRAGAAVPFHRVINNTIYGGVTPTGDSAQIDTSSSTDTFQKS